MCSGGDASTAPPAEGSHASATAAADETPGSLGEEEREAGSGGEEDRRLLEVFLGSALNPSGVLEAELYAVAAQWRPQAHGLRLAPLHQVPPAALPAVAHSPRYGSVFLSRTPAPARFITVLVRARSGHLPASPPSDLFILILSICLSVCLPLSLSVSVSVSLSLSLHIYILSLRV